MATVYLYKYREYVQLAQADRNVPNINLPMIIYDTKIYKGVTNSIEFVIRNNDRKPINLVGFDLIVQIREVNNASRATSEPEILLEKRAIMIDETVGKAKLVLDPEDIEDWNTGYFRYTVRTVNTNGQNELLYTDVNKSTWGTFELIEGIASSLVPAVEILAKNFTPVPRGYYDTLYTTGAIAGDSQAQRASGTHTIAVYTTGWRGKIWVEGSLTNEPPSPSEWFYIPLTTTTDYFEYTDKNSTSPKLINFTKNLYWVRFSYSPDPMNRGVFDKILYKN